MINQPQKNDLQKAWIFSLSLAIVNLKTIQTCNSAVYLQKTLRTYIMVNAIYRSVRVKFRRVFRSNPLHHCCI